MKYTADSWFFVQLNDDKNKEELLRNSSNLAI